MADLASLRISVDSRSADQAASDLDELTASANRAEGAADRLASTSRTTSSAMTGMSNAVRQAQAAQSAAAAAVSGLGGSARLSAHQMTNLSYQVQDLGVQLASGTPPMMAFIQQGSQIAGIMQASQMGVMGFTRAVIASTAAAVGAMVVNPVFLAIAATAATVGAAVTFMAGDITEASGVTVTATDVMLGAFDVVRGYLRDTLAAAFTAFSNATGITMDTVVQYIRRAVNTIIGIVSLIPRAFIRAFDIVPQAIDKLMGGDIVGAFALIGSEMGQVAGETFTRDFIGEIGSVLSDAAINRARIREAAEAGDERTRRSASATRDAAEADGELSRQKQKLINDLKEQAAAMAALNERFDQQMSGIQAQNRRAELDIRLIEERAKGHAEVARMMEINFREEEALNEIRANAAGYTTEQMEALIAATQEYYDLQRGAAQTESRLTRERKEAERLEKQLMELGTLMDNIFGTKGKIHILFQSMEELFPGLERSLQRGVDKVLKTLNTSMAEVSAGAQMGEMFASISKGLGLPSSKTGGQIGGALGSAFGPIGSAVGSVIGSVGVGLMKGVKKASATIETLASNEVRSTVEGNKALQKTASSMADSLIKGLQDIASALGGDLMEGIKISIGQRGKTFRVDPLGLGRTKGMIKFDTEEEAVAYAIKMALENGVVQGIKESTQRLLAAGNDLQAALEKATQFESVFARLLEKTDPLAYGLQQLDKEFENLRSIFAEAGASAEEYAQLEQLYALERADIIKEARADEIQSLNDTIDSLKDMTDSLREFRASLFAADAGVVSYRAALVDLIKIGSLAATGDMAALGKLQGASQTFLTASRARAGSLFEYQKDVALVASYVDQGIAAADQQIDAAQQQINLLDAQLVQLEGINTTLSNAFGSPSTTSGQAPVFDANLSGTTAISGGTNEQLSAMNSLLADGLYSIAKNTGGTYNLLDRWDGDGQPDIRELSSDYY